MNNLSMRSTWRALGLCLDCGNKIDNPDVYTYCKACRERRSENQREIFERQLKLERLRREKESTERAKHLAQMMRCERCDFATFVGMGSLWYCPLPICIHDMPNNIDEESEGNAEN